MARCLEMMVNMAIMATMTASTMATSTMATSTMATSPLDSLAIRVTSPSSDFCSTTLPILQDLVTEAALSLHQQHGLTISTVSVELPASLAPSCSSLLSSPPTSTSSSPALLLSPLPLLPGPLSVQPGGCGEVGLEVEVPMHWVAAATNLTMERGEQLATAITQATFGTFPTHGTEDTRFPETFTLGLEERRNCGEGGFDSEAPSPHSLLCGAVAPSTMVAAALGPRAPAPGPLSPPTFHVWAPATTSTLYILMLDRSSSMETHGRWRSLHSALARFLDDLPDGDRVAVITFDRIARTKLAPVVLTSTNRAGVHGRIPGKPGIQARACLQCAVKMAAKLAEVSEGRSQAILVTAAAGAGAGRRAAVPLAVILLGPGPGHPLPQAPSSTLYSVPEQTGNTNEDIYDLLSLIRGPERRAMKFFSERLQVKSNSSASGQFTVESGLQTRLAVTATTTMTEDIEEFSLTSPSGNLFQFPVVENGGITFHFPGESAEEGIWRWGVRMTARTVTPVVPVRVGAYAETLGATIHLEGWWAEEKVGDSAVRIFARLTIASMPVSGAKVVAIIDLPDGSVVEVDLVDDGADHPDVMASDGIYSGYFLQWAERGGWYSLRVEARGEAATTTARLEAWGRSLTCGRPVARTTHVPTGPFTRHAAAASLHSTTGLTYVIRDGLPARRDVYPPSRITDLRVEGGGDNLTLAWSAPGGDLTLGSATTYRVAWAEDRAELLRGGGEEVQEEVGEPGMVGELESLELTVPRTNRVVYYAVTARDSVGNIGRLSNIVSVYVVEEVKEETPLSSLRAAPSSLPLPPLTANLWVFVLAGSLGGVGLVVLLSVICFLRRTRNKEVREKAPVSYLTAEAPYYLATPEPREPRLPALPPVSWTFHHPEPAPYPTSSSSYTTSSSSSDTSSDRDVKAETGGLDRDSITRNSLRFSVEVESVESPSSRLSVDRDSLMVDREGARHSHRDTTSPHGRQPSDSLSHGSHTQKMKRRESFV